ncbi:MAG: hypothetical protein ACYSWZ_13310 [Planctomycetota bacterium]|jgi:hypothetical protein
MDMDTLSLIVWGGGSMFLLFRGVYYDQKLKRYVKRQYPEEGEIVWSYEWQMYPWSVGQRTLRALIKRERANDPELAYLAKKSKRGLIYFISWSVGVFFLDSFIISKYY